MSGNMEDGYLGTVPQLLLQQQLLLQVMLLQSLHPTLLALVPMLELLPILAIVERLLTILDLLPILDLPRITRKGLIGFEIVLWKKVKNLKLSLSIYNSCIKLFERNWNLSLCWLSCSCFCKKFFSNKSIKNGAHQFFYLNQTFWNKKWI